MDNGKSKEILFENRRGDKIVVWADEGCIDVIKGVDGVTDVFLSFGRTEYSVYIDPRYDLEILKVKIEAAILGREI